LVATGCDQSVANSADIILEALEKKKLELFWYASIPLIPGWLKSDWFKIIDSSSYQKWIDAILAKKKKIYKATLALRMPSPIEAVKRGKQADLLAKRVKYKKSIQGQKDRKRKTKDSDDSSDGDDEEAEIDPEEWNDVNFHMRAIMDAYPLRVEYDTKIPVFVHPSDPNRQIIPTKVLAIPNSREPKQEGQTQH
ncbi:hypothetical protein PTTG_09246, partial [Puccinia triticina 1-1 BBBD Race 1]